LYVLQRFHLVNQAAKDTQNNSIRAVPTLVVAGKYGVDINNDADRALEVVDYLLEKERPLIQGAM